MPEFKNGDVVVHKRTGKKGIYIGPDCYVHSHFGEARTGYSMVEFPVGTNSSECLMVHDSNLRFFDTTAPAIKENLRHAADALVYAIQEFSDSL